MSTELEPVPTDFEKLEKTSHVTKLDDSAAVLEQQLQHEIEKRKEERFLWIFALTGGIDMFAFQHLPVTATIAIFLLQLVFLIAAAKWCGVDFIVVLLEKLLNKYLRP